MKIKINYKYPLLDFELESLIINLRKKLRLEISKQRIFIRDEEVLEYPSQRMLVTRLRWLKKRLLMEFRRRRQQSGYFLSAIVRLNKLSNSSRLLTVRIGRRGCDEWRWIAFLASVFVIVSSDLKTDGKKKRWIRTLTVIYMSLYGKRNKEEKREEKGGKKRRRERERRLEEKRTAQKFHRLCGCDWLHVALARFICDGKAEESLHPHRFAIGFASLGNILKPVLAE